MDMKTRETNILTKPAAEWPVIAAETTAPMDLISSYAAPLSAISAICGFIGLSIIGVSMPLMGTFRAGIGSGLASAAVVPTFKKSRREDFIGVKRCGSRPRESSGRACVRRISQTSRATWPA